MDIMEVMRSRHSVRRYLGKPIPGDIAARLRDEVAACNAESGLHIQLALEEPAAFSGGMARYGNFRGVRNYFVLVGKNDDALWEKAGYYGERLVLLAQELGLNTCWVALTFAKRKTRMELAAGEKLACVIALGYGEDAGVPHKNKPLEQLCACGEQMPDWFRQGMDAALLAPTAVNQQKFFFTLRPDGKVEAKALRGPYAKMDLGIVKYHFELGAGKDNFAWA